MPASFLVRFDDICPTMNWDVWFEIENILVDYEIKPILAVVPNNVDSTLQVMPPRHDFWDIVRKWQKNDWTIGMHGYQHQYITSESGLLKLNKQSEFAGLPFTEQEMKIQKALAIFAQEKVSPELWVAPGHSFDEITINILRKYNITTVSDGYSIFPYCDGNSTFWIPQQLWQFYPMPIGVWTVCFHHKQWKVSDLERFKKEIIRYKQRITSVSRVRSNFGLRKKTIVDQLTQVFLRVLIHLKMKFRATQ